MGDRIKPSCTAKNNGQFQCRRLRDRTFHQHDIAAAVTAHQIEPAAIAAGDRATGLVMFLLDAEPVGHFDRDAAPGQQRGKEIDGKAGDGDLAAERRSRLRDVGGVDMHAAGLARAAHEQQPPLV